jgi:hypothetical protein
LPLGNFLCKLYIAASDSEKWITYYFLKLSNKGMKYDERLTGMSVIHQYHSVNVAIVVKSKFGKGFPHRRSWIDVDWRLLFTSARRTSQIGPSAGIFKSNKNFFTEAIVALELEMNW